MEPRNERQAAAHLQQAAEEAAAPRRALDDRPPDAIDTAAMALRVVLMLICMAALAMSLRACIAS